LSKTSATDMAFTWITPNPGDITGVTAGTGISGGGTSGDVTITNSMATAMTTKGDLVPATGSGTFSRLAAGTNGYILSANSAAATGLEWIANDQGDITAVTAGTGISGGGTSGAVTITNSMATEITASGDIIVGTGSGTFDNLPIGTTGQILTADTTVSPYKVKWATAASGGGMTLISTTTLSGASVTLSSIPSTYVNLQLFFVNMTNNTADGVLRIAPNGGTDYAYANTISAGTAGSYSASYIRNVTNLTRTETANSLTVTIYNYSMDDFVPFTINGGIRTGAYVPETVSGFTYAASGSGITSLVITNSGGTWSGGTVYLYGVK